MRGRTAMVVAAAVLLASVAASPDAAVGTDPAPSDTREEPAYTSASCDQNDAAFDVQPDTPEAWADAAAWCTRSGEWLDNADWPSGFSPAPLPVDISSGN